MRRKKQTFNELLIRYNKYLRKLKNLRLMNRNERRQVVLTKHIERLYNQLMSLKINIQKGAVAATIALGAMAFTSNDVVAQNFEAPQTNPFSLINTGAAYFTPTFGDLDNDGDFDIIADDGYGSFVYFKNTGTNIAPLFAAPVTDPFGLLIDTGSVLGGGHTHQTLVDLDNDGDLDLMVGSAFGYSNELSYFHYFENTGTNVAPAFAAVQENPFGLVNIDSIVAPTSIYIGLTAAPSFGDLDNDGDLDLMVGEAYGDFIYFENTGTKVAPAFSTPTKSPYGLTNIGHNAAPFLVDLDKDGDLDLMSGHGSGDFYYFENTGTNVAPAFAAVQENPFSLINTPDGYSSEPAIVDLDNDGNLDLLTAGYDGFFYYPGSSSTNAVGIDDLEQELAELKLFPNPTTGNTVLDLEIVNTAQVVVTDIAGKQVFSSYAVEGEQVQIPSAGFNSGVYFVKVQSDNQQRIIKLIKE